MRKSLICIPELENQKTRPGRNTSSLHSSTHSLSWVVFLRKESRVTCWANQDRAKFPAIPKNENYICSAAEQSLVLHLTGMAGWRAPKGSQGKVKVKVAWGRYS